ncbi:MAG: hypothetical protein C0467_28175 [Planctomycetaceae bacterium]|nr:hypothetical protein [Planctomycetaceae bacterium]
MSQLEPYAPLILEAVQEIHRRHAIAGWYDVRYLIKWLQSKRKPELKALYDAYRDAPDPKQAVQSAIEAYLPALNQKKMGTIAVEPKGSVIMWKVSSKTAPPPEAPPPTTEAPPPERPRRVRGQPWVALIDKGDLAGLRRWLDAGGDPNAPGRAKGEEPLDYAASSGDVPLVRLLLERGARGRMPLLEAVLNVRGEVARLLLEHGAPTRDDLSEARAVVRDLVDDDELYRLIEKELRRRRK